MIKELIVIVLFILVFLIQVRSQFNNRITQQIKPQTIDSTNYPIFKTYPAYYTDSLEFCNIQSNSFVKYFKYGLEEYVALSLKTCGFNVLNLRDPSNPKLEVNFPIQSGKINKFSFESLRNILWIAQSEGKVYYIEVAKKPFKVELGFQTNNSQKIYFIEFIPNVDNAILAFCFNEIQIFQIGNSNQGQINNFDVSSIKYFKSITLNNSNEMTNIKFINNLLFVGSFLQGVQIYQIDKAKTIDINVTFIRNIIANQFPLIDFYVISRNIIYIKPAFGGIYSYNAIDCVTKADATSCKNISLLENKSRPQRAGNMYITKDEKYIITHYSSFGIQILDITTNKMKTFQTIDYTGEATSLTMNESESLIIQSGSTKFQIFQKQKSIIALDKPNILLHIVQNVDQTFYRDPYLLSPENDCLLDSQKNIVYVSRGVYGLAVLKKNPQGVLKTITKLEESVKGQSFGTFRFFLDLTLAYVIKGPNGLAIIDFQNPEQPVFIKNNLKFGVQGPFNFLECSICIYCGVVILDITNLLDPQLLLIYPISNFNDIVIFSIYFMRSKKVIFLGGDQYGVFAFNLEDVKNPQKISSLYLTDGSGLILTLIQLKKNNQILRLFHTFKKRIHFDNKFLFIFNIILSKIIKQKNFQQNFCLLINRITSDDKYLIASSSYKGISIIDISDLKNLKIVSTVNLFGRMPKLYFMSNEKYLIIPASEKPALFLINIQDKINPILFQTIKRNTIEGLMAMCFDKDENEGFISTGKPLIQTNFKNQVIFNQVIYELIPIPGSDEKKIIDIDITSPLLVGQIVNIRLLPLNTDNPISIKKVMIYENYTLQPLKSWMVFQSEQSLLQLVLVKDALQQDKQGNYIQTSQYVIFQSHIALDSSSFINSFLNIDIALSTKILQECYRQGYLDDVYMVNENFNLQGTISINFDKIYDSISLASLTSEKKDDIINAIRYVFKHSIVYYPIEFIVVPSIQFDLQNQEAGFIKSFKEQVALYIKVSQGSGRFVIKNYAGILCIISQEQDEIRIEGDTSKLNEVLKQKIKFSSNIPHQNIYFYIKVQDNINYDIEKKISYEEALFISEQSKVSMLNQQSIKNDFSIKFEDSSIYIRERFTYQIPFELFDCEDVKQLEFFVKIKNSDGEYKDLPQNHWLQFSQKDRLLSGMPSEKELFHFIEIQITITDQYSFIIQKFDITVSKIPFSYIMQFFIQYFGPLLGLIGVWKYKYKMYNLILKKNYTYSKESIFAGKFYQKQILLNNWNIKIANRILDYFKQTVSNKEIISQIYLYQASIVKSDNLNSRSNIQKLNSEISSPLTQFETSSRLQTYFQSPKQCGQVIDEVVENSSQEPSQKNIVKLPQLQTNLKLLKMSNSPSEISQINCFSEEQIFKNSQQEHKSVDNSPNIQTKQNSILEFNEKQQKYEQQFQKKETLNLVQQSRIIDNQQRRRQSSVHSLISLNNQQNTQKRFSKQLKKQIEKVSQSSLEQKKIDEMIKIEIRQKSKSVQRSEMWMFDSQGNLNYSQIIEHLLSNCQNQNIKNKLLTKEVIDNLQNPNSLLRQTFQGFLAEFILQKDSFSYDIFKELYNRSQQSWTNPQWYSTYCTVSANIDKIHINPVPSVIFDDQIFEQQLPFSFHLVKETIKTYALGFISNSVKLKPLSTGESLHIESYNIKQIMSQSQKADNLLQQIKSGMKYQCKKRVKKGFIEKPLVDNFKLPPWIKSVEIINNNLLVEGTPQNKDIGRFNFFIYDKSNLIVRAFEIEVIGSQLKDISIQDNEPNQLITTDKNDDTILKFNSQKNSNQYSNSTENINLKLNDNLIFSIDHQNQNEIDLVDEKKQPHMNQFTL